MCDPIFTVSDRTKMARSPPPPPMHALLPSKLGRACSYRPSDAISYTDAFLRRLLRSASCSSPYTLYVRTAHRIQLRLAECLSTKCASKFENDGETSCLTLLFSPDPYSRTYQISFSTTHQVTHSEQTSLPDFQRVENYSKNNVNMARR